MAKYLIIKCELDSYREEIRDFTPVKTVDSLEGEKLVDCSVYELHDDGSVTLVKSVFDVMEKGFALWHIKTYDPYERPEKIVVDYSTEVSKKQFLCSRDLKKWIKKMLPVIYKYDWDIDEDNTEKEIFEIIKDRIDREGACGWNDDETDIYWCIGGFEDNRFDIPY